MEVAVSTFPSRVIGEINAAQRNMEHLPGDKEDVDPVRTFPRPTACHPLIRRLCALSAGVSRKISRLLSSHPQTYIRPEESERKARVRDNWAAV